MRIPHMTGLAAAMAIALPLSAFAAGGGSSTPPSQTNTTTQCKNGQIWDANTRTCVNPQSGSLDDDTLYGAAREFAYAGQYGAALAALDAMAEGESDRVLTYRGFAHRKMGEPEAAMAFYTAALVQNPDNLLARSYMGQGLAEAGDKAAARGQLTEIRARGGRGSWAEFSLRQAIESGQGYAY